MAKPRDRAKPRAVSGSQPIYMNLAARPMRPEEDDPPELFMYIFRAISPACMTADSLLESPDTLPSEDFWSKSCVVSWLVDLPAWPTWQKAIDTHLASLTHGHANQGILAAALKFCVNRPESSIKLWFQLTPLPPPPENIFIACMAAADPILRSSTPSLSSPSPYIRLCWFTTSALCIRC
jgi:hypothetical protein